MKRKRSSVAAKQPRTAFARKVARARMSTASSMVVVPGVTRSIGYYGRFTGPSGELKFLDSAVSETPIGINGTVLGAGSLNLIAQGAGESQRVGRKVTLTKVMFRGIGFMAGDTTGGTAAESVSSNQMRIILYWDKQCNGAVATAGGILGPGTVTIDSFNELVAKDRFRILKDKIIDFNRTTSVHDGTDFVPGSVTRKVFFSKNCNIPIEFEGATGALTEIRSNNLSFLLVSRNATSPLTFTGTCRIRYSDH